MPPRRPGCRAASGRCTTRCSRTRDLWERARRLGLDLDRFEADRRAEALAARVERDFRSGIRAGVATTPTLFVEGESHPGVPGPELLARLSKRRSRAS
jgi:protein-disulfide isomerase